MTVIYNTWTALPQKDLPAQILVSEWYTGISVVLYWETKSSVDFAWLLEAVHVHRVYVCTIHVYVSTTTSPFNR